MNRFHPIRFITSFFYYIFFFILIYNETLEIFGIKFSMIWKVPVVIYLLIYSLNKFKKGFWIISILLSISVLINTGFPRYSFYDISQIIEILSIPLLYFYTLSRFKDNPETLKIVLISSSVFFIVSSIPFIFNVLEPRGLVKELDNFGTTGNMLNGIFFHPSISSKVYVTSTIILFYFLLKKQLSILVYTPILLLGIYAVYGSFTRTGWLTLIIGVVFIYYKYSSRLKFLMLAIPIMLILFGVLFLQIQKNDFLFKRIVGTKTLGSNDEMDVNQLSSNRILLYYSAIQIIKKENLTEKVLGLGQYQSIKRMEAESGHALIAHNRFLEITLMGGLISLFLYLLYLFKIYKIIFKVEIAPKYLLLSKTLFILLIIYNFPSHGFPLWCNFLFALALAYEKIEIQNKEV